MDGVSIVPPSRDPQLTISTGKLKEQEEYLDEYVTGRFAPILCRPPDKVSGEVFPTMWFASPIALTGMQHMIIAKMILLAESPLLS